VRKLANGGILAGQQATTTKKNARHVGYRRVPPKYAKLAKRVEEIEALVCPPSTVHTPVRHHT
jgi:hypothetical protein